MSTPVFMVSVCSSVKIKGRDCGTINGHDESASIQTLMKDERLAASKGHCLCWTGSGILPCVDAYRQD
ncbi:hypothetical protein FNH43_21780 [Salmonella enterica subsp. salamae]|nr:hypothetical protein [Salmonella enterica subsp. salamae]